MEQIFILPVRYKFECTLLPAFLQVILVLLLYYSFHKYAEVDYI